MARKWFLGPMIVALLVSFTLPALAQESAVKGGLGGTVYDTSGAVVPGAKVTIVGPIGTTSKDSDQEGHFTFQVLIPGFYSVKVEKEGFKVADIKNVEVFTNRTSSIRVTLEAGAITQIVEVAAPAISVDTATTAVGANLTDTFYNLIPVARSVPGLFYASAGVVSGLGTGASNPSISGGTGLENQYIVDGVPINDPAFGGFAVYSRIFGSLGSGVNLSFVKEVQVKTAGYEPQYGKSTGGIVQIVTKAGSRDFHGGVAGFFAPQELEALRKQRDDFASVNFFGKVFHVQNYDVAGEVGGYVPGFRDKLFFFGSYNPSWQTGFAQPPPSSGLFATNPNINRETFTQNYAGKLTWKLSEKHSVEGSVFADPTTTNSTQWRGLNTANATAFSKLEYGQRNVVARYNGAWTPTWLFNGSFIWNRNEFTEIPEQDVVQISDRTGSSLGIFTRQGLGFSENYDSRTYGLNLDTSKSFRWAGEHTFNVGYRYEAPFYDNIKSRSGGLFPLPAANLEGTTLVSMGVPADAIGALTDAQLQLRRASTCTICPTMVLPGFATPQRVFLRQTRGEYGLHTVNTKGRYQTAYLNDAWSPNKYVTMNLGVRWEQQLMQGSTLKYTFTGNWSPRLGVTVDPWGNRKSKAFANFGRYDYAIPLDMAIRSLSTELDAIGIAWLPRSTGGVADLDARGNPIFVPDAAHLANQAAGAPSGFAGPTGAAPGISQQVGGGIASGTKMAYLDEWAVGFEREFGAGVIVSGRYIDRRYRRIVEDIAAVTPEAFHQLTQNYLITNVNANTDLFVNEQPQFVLGPTATFGPDLLGPDINGDGRPDPDGIPDNLPGGCFDANGNPTPFIQDPVTDSLGNPVGAACWPGLNAAAWSTPRPNPSQPGQFIYDPIPGVLFGGELGADGILDGFPNPVRIYQAVEIEVNKAFSKNWMLRANWRIAKLQGNFEGAFRNDNGQSDPSITSLFDFTQGVFGLLGDQFKPGVLNTDRRHVVNAFFGYTFDRSWAKGLTLGTGVRVESGLPITRFKAHPAYENSGEIPMGGRGSLGQTSVTEQVDLKVDYVRGLTEKTRIRLAIDLFNITNSRRVTLVDQNEDVTVGLANVEFLKPISFQRPFYARAMVRFEF